MKIPIPILMLKGNSYSYLSAMQKKVFAEKGLPRKGLHRFEGLIQNSYSYQTFQTMRAKTFTIYNRKVFKKSSNLLTLMYP